ncbi:MAG: signal peptide peptidase SppA, partial [candidate division WOR-3 bacterium]|nr:signal peptide peptidase SppA [candidate division WOR-3 bacterium]MDW7988234.1 signal peptide peptidase SppA [candidate division WOR-3 bacterium]
LVRPNRYLSIAGVVESITRPRKPNYLVGLGIRPVNEQVTLTLDYDFRQNEFLLGFEAEPVLGLQVKCGYNTNRTITFQVGITQGQLGWGAFYKNALSANGRNKLTGYFSFHKEVRHKLIKEKNRLLELTLSGRIAERKSGFSLLGTPVSFTTYDLLRVINKAKTDPEIKGIVLKLHDPQMSLVTAQELKFALDEFKAQGKKIIVYAPNLDLTKYYFICNANKVITHPLGEVTILGITAQATFLKEALSKLGITVDYERIGKYKNAPEFYTQDTISHETYEVLNSVLDNCYEDIIKTIAQARNKSEEEVKSDLDYGFFSSQTAKERKLIDTTLYEDELDSFIRAEFRKFRKVSAASYGKEKRYNYRWGREAKIAIIYAEGQIVEGADQTNPITGVRSCGARTLVRLLRKARSDPEIKAIVLRIDSPGGDGFASDLIWREVFLTRSKKPIIVSMSQVAASGGYYIAMLGNKIFALPATITGSIGVFSMKIITQGMYQKLGIKNIRLKRGEHADMFSPDRPFTEDERKILKEQLKLFYEQFISKVAAARNLSLEYVDSIAQGRIWTGKQALDNRLIDSIGNFWTALECAKDFANEKEVAIEILPQNKFLGFNFPEILFSILSNK